MRAMHRGAAYKRRAMLKKPYAKALCGVFKSLGLALQQSY